MASGALSFRVPFATINGCYRELRKCQWEFARLKAPDFTRGRASQPCGAARSPRL